MRTTSSNDNDKNYFIGRFPSGLPNFSKKKSAENKWTLQKDGLQNRQISDTLRVILSVLCLYFDVLMKNPELVELERANFGSILSWGNNLIDKLMFRCFGILASDRI